MKAALLAALPVLLASRSAWPCGGDSSGDSGGSSGGGSSDSSSSDSSSSDSSSSSSAPACVDTSEIVGRAECRGFGTWDSRRVPAVIIGVGSSLHFFSLRGLRFAGTAEHDTGIQYAVMGEEASDGAAAATWDLRTTMNVGRYLYAGAETRIGRLYIDHRTLRPADDLVVEPAGVMYGTTGLIAGVRVPLGDLELRAEAAAGVRMMSLEMTSRQGECVAQSRITDLAPMVETRLGAAAWLSPWLTLSASVGTSALDRSAVTGGVALEGHMRAFDGGR